MVGSRTSRTGQRGGDGVRRARSRDLSELLAIEQRSFSVERLSRASLRRFLSDSKARTLVVERGGQLDGYALLTFPAGRAHARLYSLAVAPNVRGHGIGRRLLAAAEAAAAKAGRATLRLEVRRDNAAARRLYRSRGFGEVGQRLDYYGDGCEALRLEKPLAPRGPSRG